MNQTSTTEKRNAESTRSQEHVPNFFKISYKPDFVWTANQEL